jgi:hypothetical protein
MLYAGSFQSYYSIITPKITGYVVKLTQLCKANILKTASNSAVSHADGYYPQGPYILHTPCDFVRSRNRVIRRRSETLNTLPPLSNKPIPITHASLTPIELQPPW